MHVTVVFFTTIESPGHEVLPCGYRVTEIKPCEISWSCGSYVSLRVQLKIVQLILCNQYLYYINIYFLTSSHMEPHQNYIFTQT